MHRLELGWSAVAIASDWAIDTNGDALSRLRDRLFDAGQDIRAARRHARLTLRELSSISGISLAHLSRIERGANAGRQIYQEDPADHDLERDDRQVMIVHPVLAGYVRRWRTRGDQGLEKKVVSL